MQDQDARRAFNERQSAKEKELLDGEVMPFPDSVSFSVSRNKIVEFLGKSHKVYQPEYMRLQDVPAEPMQDADFEVVEPAKLKGGDVIVEDYTDAEVLQAPGKRKGGRR